MRSYPAFPGVPPQHLMHRRHNPHVGWWIAGGLLVLGAISFGAFVWYDRHKQIHTFHGTLSPITCERYAGHRICIYAYDGGSYAGTFEYRVDDGPPTANAYGSATEAALAAKLFVTILAGDITVKDDGKQQQQAA